MKIWVVLPGTHERRAGVFGSEMGICTPGFECPETVIRDIIRGRRIPAGCVARRCQGCHVPRVPRGECKFQGACPADQPPLKLRRSAEAFAKAEALAKAEARRFGPERRRTPRLLWLTLCLCVSVARPSAVPQQGPPKDPNATRAADLVELVKLDPTIKLDIRYAGTNNFLGKPVYKEARAFLQRPAAEALVAAHRELARDGYGLLIHDGYRPWAITKLFWDMTSGFQREFVADPATGSKHNRGCAVDLTMYDLASGRPSRCRAGTTR